MLAGRTDSNLAKIKKIMKADKLTTEMFYLCYNTKQMASYGHWKRQRGLANSKSIEQALYEYKGRVPKNMPKNRMHIDNGSSLFNQVVRNVPVLAPKHHAYVSREVREASLATMAGVPHDEDQEEKENLKRKEIEEEGEQEDAEEQDKVHVAANLKKRKLYRQHTGQEVPWFPHDNDMELLKEFVWEAGRPRWVFHCTPAGGAGIHGCLEMGCSVVALCYDEHHRTHLQTFLLQRAVEAMVSGQTLMFKDEDLQARSIELNLAEEPKKPKKVVEKDDEKAEKADEKTKKADEKTKKAEKPDKTESSKQAASAKGAANKKKQQATSAKAKSAADTSESDSDDDEESESVSEPPAKKHKK